MARSSNRTRQWSELLHWLKRFRADPDFEKEERTYKVALADIRPLPAAAS